MKTWLDITEGFPVEFDVARMKADLERFQNSEAWLGHYDTALSQGWRAILLKSLHGDVSGPQSQAPTHDFSEYALTRYVDQLPYFRDLMDQLKCPQGRMRIMRLQPGMVINLHYDTGPEVACLAFRQVRLHVPIVTNDRVTFFVGGEKIKMVPGHIYYVNFSKKHYVRNDGDEARTHLVMDLKVNDWLAQYFPKPTRWEQVENVTARTLWPVVWRLRWWRLRNLMRLRAKYEGSRAQALYHRIRDRHRAAA
jgi:hypothetical protein